MITLEDNNLVFRFPNIHRTAECSIQFQRTLRIPNDGKRYPLPPGLGTFPLRHVDDFGSRLDEKHRQRGGVIMPMHQSEALWINFATFGDYPFAVKVATGKICAVSGESWFNHLNQDPQDYVILPEQPWLDGYCVEKDTIRQFVAAPLGKGHTVEEQVSGTAEVGGLQFVVYPMKRAFYDLHVAPKLRRQTEAVYCASLRVESNDTMGLAAGGQMSQQIYQDEWGLKAWDMRNGSRCFVTIANSEQWWAITNEAPPHNPPSAEEYSRFGLPWFEYYKDAQTIEGSEKLRNVKPIGELDHDGASKLDKSVEIASKQVISVGKSKPRTVREFGD